MLLHNPKAGDAEHSKKALTKLMEDHGFACRYISVKDEWQDFNPDIDFIAMAGGDGTVRKVLKGLDDKELGALMSLLFDDWEWVKFPNVSVILELFSLVLLFILNFSRTLAE